MATIETSWLNNPGSNAHCALNEDYSIDIANGENQVITLDAREAYNLCEFLQTWKRQILNAAEKADELAADRA